MVVLCGMNGQAAAKVTKPPSTTTVEDVEQASSYATGDDLEEGGLEINGNIANDGWMEGLEDIKTCIARLEASQNGIVVKLAELEKVVLAVQEDTIWLRGDVRVVHEVVEKLADHASMLNNTVVEVEGVANVGPPLPSAWGHWPDDVHAEAYQTPKSKGVEEDVRAHLCEDDAMHGHVGHDFDTTIQETQVMDMTAGVPGMIRSPAAEVGVGGWFEKRVRADVVASPIGTQPRRRTVDDAVEDGFEEMELTLPGTLAPGRSMWDEFTSTVRDMHAPSHGGGERDDGCVGTKRGRQGSPPFGGSKQVETGAITMKGHGNLNLNLSPEKLDSSDCLGGRGGSGAALGRGAGSRGRGRMGGRGTCRGKRPPPMQPRYTSTASVCNLNCVFGRGLWVGYFEFCVVCHASN